MHSNSLKGIRLYLLWAVACILTGWALSALRWLSPACLAFTLPLVAAGLFWLTRNPAAALPLRRHLTRILFRRFRRPLPLFFSIAALFVFIGGAIHAPNNYDALNYRLPRMLNWLSSHGWTWISTINPRLNFSGTGWEWIAMPLLALRSDRALFLLNAVGFLLLPGLIFSVFRRAGVARRVAWAWMWILPMGFGYALQAGSIGNDLMGAVFCLISVHYGLRARRSGRVEDVWLAGLAAAIMTGIKTSNLPLALPCLVAAGPALKHLRNRWAAGILIAVIALVISAVPMAVLNQINTGHWTGDPQNRSQMRIKNPVAGLVGNSILVGQQLLMPPILPGASKVDDWLKKRLSETWKRELTEHFPRLSMTRLNELPQEEASSLGLGIAVLLVAAVGSAVFRRGKKNGGLRMPRAKASLVGLAAWGAGLFFMLKMGSESAARLMLPYYPLALIPLLILPGQNCLARRAWWRLLAGLASFSVLPCLVLTPSRPLWPAHAVSQWLARDHHESPLTQRLMTVYLIYQNRNDLLAPLRKHLPDAATNIGFFAGSDDTDYSLWLPFGHRRVVCLRDGTPQSPVSLPPDIEWIVVKHAVWPEITVVPLETWAIQHGMEIVSSVQIMSYARQGEETWSLLRVKRP